MSNNNMATTKPHPSTGSGANRKTAKPHRKISKLEILKKTLIALASLIIFIILYLFAVDFNFLGLFGKSPSMDSLMNPQNSVASIIFSEDGEEIGKLYHENRVPELFGQINPVFWEALVSTEDERFYEHNGIDFLGFGAATKDFIVHGHARGASTITQQLVKNLFRVRTQYSTGLLGKIPGIKILIQKSKEWISAIKLEMFYSKNEILCMYANTVDFGSNAFGIKTACKTYFNTTPKELKTEEAAVLVGILKATSFYNPVLNPENSKKRRNTVLDNMRIHGYLTQQECDSLSALPLTLHFTKETENTTTAMYFRDAVIKELQEWCEISGVDLYSDGLKIYTTLDSKMQRIAEKAAFENMRVVQKDFELHWDGKNPWEKEQPNLIDDLVKKTSYYRELSAMFPDNPDSVNYYLNKAHKTKVFSYYDDKEKELNTIDSIRYMCKFLHCAFVAMDPHNGHVKAWVGDVDYNSWKYDKVMATHQPGSTFKLFVYTEAMNQGMSPNDVVLDSPISITDPKNETWIPNNANGSYSYSDISLETAFAKSINTIAVKLGQTLGLSSIARTAKKMGITTKLEETPAMTLGASDVKLVDLTAAYSVIANGGEQVTPILVTKIVDAKGNVIYQPETEKRRILPESTVYYMQRLLIGGVRHYYGTSHNLMTFIGNINDTDFGGKTGTTNNHSDGWFVGVTPHLVAGAWVGGEYRSIHFRNAQGQGSRTALPICAQFLERVFNTSSFKSYHGHFEDFSDKYGKFTYETKKVVEDTLAVDSIDVEAILKEEEETLVQ